MADDKVEETADKRRRFRFRLVRILMKAGVKEEYFLILLSILIGVATGLFAHVFFYLVEAASEFAYGHGEQRGLFVGRAWMLALLPVAGAVLVGLITYYFAREAKGHGVPEVMDAIYRKGGVIRPRVAGAKTIASAFTIGSGGSAGMEGPIIQIGAAIGSSVGQFLHLERRQMGIVIACGVSAGIAAIFNAPIAGVLFALEIFLRDFSFRTFSPVVFSSVISCSVMHMLRLDDAALFEVGALRGTSGGGSLYFFSISELPLFLLLGVLCALASVLYIRALYATEDVFDGLRIPEPLKPALGALGLGLTGAAYFLLTRSEVIPPFFANGYPAVEATLGRGLLDMTVVGLLSLFALKLLATCLTLGSGGSGGIFAPALLMGATLGGALGLAMHQGGLIDEHSVCAFALVGMAAVVGGTTHAPLTAIVILYEITREPRVILPVMFAVIVATFGAQLLCRDSIYTLKLRRRGVRLGTLADLTILKRIVASDVMRLAAPIVHPEEPLQKLIDIAGETEAVDFVVVDEQNAYQGMVMGKDLRTALLQPEAVSLLLVSELMRSGVPVVHPGETLDNVLDKFARSEVDSLPMCDRNDSTRIDGLITRQAVMRRYQQELDKQAG